MVVSVSDLLRQSRTADDEQPRTEYVIRLTAESKLGGWFVAASGNGRHWTQTVSEAKRFEFMTSANVHAVMELGLALEQYEVVPVHGRR